MTNFKIERVAAQEFTPEMLQQFAQLQVLAEEKPTVEQVRVFLRDLFAKTNEEPFVDVDSDADIQAYIDLLWSDDLI